MSGDSLPQSMVDETHDPAAQSWVESANNPATDFPLQNLPLGVFRKSSGAAKVGVAIGDQILDLAAALDATRFADTEVIEACRQPTLNRLMSMGRERSRKLRRHLFQHLRDSASSDARMSLEKHLHKATECELLLPAAIGDYTDFYASIFHATNVGSMFRPDNPLLPNYKWVPIGYHGRASSIVVSGTDVRRPEGQTSEGNAPPVFGPSKRLDYELELGIFVGAGNRLGESIPIAESEEHMFGICLLNDWSARDVQAWEYQPLGPFLAKNFASSISPWVVTMDALTPFHVPAFKRPDGDPQPLPYLFAAEDQKAGGIAVRLEVLLQSEKMKQAGIEPQRLSESNFDDVYWTVSQLLTHHASNGCNLQPGDLLGSGTVSGRDKPSRGCLLELAWRGQEPVTLPTGEKRAFLQDGDAVIFRGWCEREGFRRIGFGECRGRVLPTAG